MDFVRTIDDFHYCDMEDLYEDQKTKRHERREWEGKVWDYRGGKHRDYRHLTTIQASNSASIIFVLHMLNGLFLKLVDESTRRLLYLVSFWLFYFLL